MAIDFDIIKDNALYSTREVCDLINIKTSRYFVDLKKKYNIQPSARNGKSYLYSGKEIKKFLKKRLAE